MNRLEQLTPQDREPALGSHLVTRRRGYLHHGIYVGDGKVVHYSGLASGLHRGPVEEVPLDRFTRGQSVWVKFHANSNFHAHDVIERARSRVGEDGYRLLTNNCEHFCEWCLRGEHRSYQVDALLARLRVLRAAVRFVAQSIPSFGRATAGLIMLVYLVGGCAAVTAQPDAESPVQATPPPENGTPITQPSASELDQLVAPIALYPDALVAQILAAATYPAQVVEADRWMQQHSDLNGDALAQAVDSQPWDPSVKALTQFPSVLQMMDKNLAWTSSLGEACVNGQQVVLDAVQVLRQRAQTAGNLQSTQQETVTTDGQAISIEPTDPEVVYVPEYDPWDVYGAPVAYYPGWYGFPGLYIDGPGIVFGLGVGVGVFGGFGWGWHHWGADWHRHDLMHDHDRYVSHSPTFINHNDFGHGHPQIAHPGGFPHADIPHGGLPNGGFAHRGFSGGAPSGIHATPFSGFDHGGVTHSFSARGSASFNGGFHGGGIGHVGGAGHR